MSAAPPAAIQQLAIDWGQYHSAHLISSEHLALIMRFDGHEPDEQRELLASADGGAVVGALLGALGALNKDDSLAYLVSLLDGILKMDRDNWRLFFDARALAAAAAAADADAAAAAADDASGAPWSPLFRALNRQSIGFAARAKAGAALGALLAARANEPALGDLLTFLNNALVPNGGGGGGGGSSSGAPTPLNVSTSSSAIVPPSSSSSAAAAAVAAAAAAAAPAAGGESQRLACLTLRTLLASAALRARLAAAPHKMLDRLVDVARDARRHVQLLYEALYCLWLFSFDAALADGAHDATTSVVALLVDTLRTQDKEKVTRVALAALANLVDRGDNNARMVDAGLLKVLATLNKRQWPDEEAAASLETLSESMRRNMIVLSSFEMYAKEVTSGKLEWSPVHTSDAFWHENIGAFEEKDFQLVKMLKQLAMREGKPEVQAIAAHDLGEFARVHPQGKQVLERIGGKGVLLGLMAHTNATIQKEALMALQKVLITSKMG